MEVHHHSHTPRKRWTHYFWEFLMLFLAVSLGFLVENQREHYIERQRAVQYAHSLLEDLKADTTELNSSINDTRFFSKSVDTLLMELDKPNAEKNDTIIQLKMQRLERYSFYDPQLATYDQLKNSGSLRYFNIQLIKKLNYYEQYANYILKLSNQQLEFISQHLFPLVNQLQNPRFIRAMNEEISFSGPIPGKRNDDVLIDQLYAAAYSHKRTYDLIVRRMETQVTNASDLIKMLEEKYTAH